MPVSGAVQYKNGGNTYFGYFSRHQSSRRNLSNDVAEHVGLSRKISKIRTTPVLVSHPKQI